MSILPDYDVILWLQSSRFTEKLEQEIVSSVDIPPYERFEADGVLDIHWGFDEWNGAVQFLEKLRKYKDNPNVILLKASNPKNRDASIVVKDER